MSIPIDISPKEYVSALNLLKKIDFLEGVPEDTLKELLISIQKISFEKQKSILFQGEISNRLHIIQSGSVTISTKHKGNKIHLAELTSPNYFGEISLLRPTSATATVVAGEEGVGLLIISHDALTHLSHKIPDIETRIQRVIDARLASDKKAKEADDNS